MRERSFWGWGWADRFPGERDALGPQVAMLTGATPRPHEPPALDAVDMPASRLEVPGDLEEFVAGDRRSRALHTYGRSFEDVWRGFVGDFRAAPDLVATPRDDREIERVLEWAAKQRVAVIPFGGGTSVVGGVEAAVGDGFEGALALDTTALERVLEIDDTSLLARIQGGARGPVLENQLAESGLTLRFFPQSFEFSTLGGWIATRAGGHFATLQTHIDDLVASVRMLTPSGEWKSLLVPGSAAGPSPDRLALGSEGIFGVITDSWVRVRPRPRFRARATVRFREFDRAVACARELAQSGLHPSNCRVLDRVEALINAVVADGSSVLLLGFESDDHPLEPWMERALAIARQSGGTPGEPRYRAASADGADTGQADDKWKAAFIEAPYRLNALVSLGVIADTFETACTWSQFAELHREVTGAVGAVLRDLCGGGVVACRLTHVYPDGPAPYYTFVAPGGPAERGSDTLDRWRAVKRAAGDAVIAAGGTITHHHAVGRMHRPWYDRQTPEPFARALRAAKDALDPAGVLNPGVLV